MSICAWLKTDSVDTLTGDFIVSRTADAIGTPYGFLAYDDGTGNELVFVFSNNGPTLIEQWATDNNVFSTGSWFHACAVRNSGLSDVDIYVNGVDKEAVNFGDDVITVTTQSANTAIGRAGDDPADAYWDGIIDDVRVYNRALSTAEVQQLYKLGTVIIRP
jgi:hypothetical protein